MENFVKIKRHLFCLTAISFLLHISGCGINNAERNNKTSGDILIPSGIVLSEFIFEKAHLSAFLYIKSKRAPSSDILGEWGRRENTSILVDH
jgi:hypothetical protein